MARLLSRLGPALSRSPLGFKAWADKLCTQIEDQFIDILAALASMPDIPNVTIEADYTGTVSDGQLPRTVQAYRYTNTTDNTAEATWSFETDNGGVTATIDAGELEITDITATTQVTVSSLYQNVSKSRTFTVYFNVAGAPSTGAGGGTSATDTTFSGFNSATMATVSDELTVTVGSAGQVQLSAPLVVYGQNGAPSGTFKVWGIWQWWDGAAWTDLGTEVSSSPDCVIGGSAVNNGQISVSHSKTGLTPSASEKFRLQARNDSGTRTMYFSGTASAVGS